MQNSDEALSIIIFAGRSILVKMLITLELHHTYDQILHTYTFFFKLAGKMTKKRKKI